MSAWLFKGCPATVRALRWMAFTVPVFLIPKTSGPAVAERENLEALWRLGTVSIDNFYSFALSGGACRPPVVVGF